MDRRTLLVCGIAALIPVDAFSARAETETRLPRVVFIAGGTEAGARPVTKSFLDGVRQAGQVQGQTVQIHFRFGDRDPARVRALIHESVAEAPAVLVVDGLTAQDTQRREARRSSHLSADALRAGRQCRGGARWD
jgi:hypothetical protein